MSCLGIDVGGANLKGATSAGWHFNRSFALWRAPAELAGALSELVAAAPNACSAVATMTGELADCFRTKREGVRYIVDALVDACGTLPLKIYRTDGQFVSAAQAIADPLPAAASNWHALAAYVARQFDLTSGLLIDLGSTTCDIIPLASARPIARGQTDLQRLLTGELVYTGVARSPVCAVVHQLPYREQACAVAQELFATTLDAYVVLGDIAEAPDDSHTADGRPATRLLAVERLARCLCADSEQFDEQDALVAARAIRQAQLSALQTALARVLASMAAAPETIVISGQGEFLLRELLAQQNLTCTVLSLTQTLGSELSRVAPAYALANLWESQLA